MSLSKRLEILEKKFDKLMAEENLIIIFHDINKREVAIQASEEKTYQNCDYKKAIGKFRKETGIDINKSGSILIRISSLGDDYPELAAVKKRIQGKKDIDSNV